jgi:hypothetical protein
VSTVVRLAVDAVRGRRRTRNVLADTAGDGEDPHHLVMHLADNNAQQRGTSGRGHAPEIAGR